MAKNLQILIDRNRAELARLRDRRDQVDRMIEITLEHMNNLKRKALQEGEEIK